MHRLFRLHSTSTCVHCPVPVAVCLILICGKQEVSAVLPGEVQSHKLSSQTGTTSEIEEVSLRFMSPMSFWQFIWWQLNLSLWGENIWVCEALWAQCLLQIDLKMNLNVLRAFMWKWMCPRSLSSSVFPLQQVYSLEIKQQKWKMESMFLWFAEIKRVPEESSQWEQVECCSWVLKQGHCCYDWNPMSNAWDGNLWQRALFSKKKQTLVA